MLNFEYPPLGGGSSPVTRGLARELASRGHRVDVVTTGFRGLPSHEDDGAVGVHRVRAPRRRSELSRVHELAGFVGAALFRTSTLVRAHRFDVCHCHFLLPTGLVPYLLRGVSAFPPYVLTSHGSDVPGYNPDRFRTLHRFTPPLLRRIVAAASAVIVPSAAQERLLRACLGAGEVEVAQIPNGVDVQRFHPQLKERRVLVAARLFERKGVQHVLEALARTKAPRASIDVAGDGPARSALERLARERGIEARFHGWLPRERLDRLFERSRVFVLATASDNFPVSLLEAMAARCAIVTTRAGGCPEVVGEAALLVDLADVNGLARALERLLSEDALAAELGRLAAARAQDRFAWTAIAERHEAVYRGAIEAAAGAVAPAGRWVTA